MRLILDQLTLEENPENQLQNGGKYPVWSPYGAESAAQKLRELLTAESA